MATEDSQAISTRIREIFLAEQRQIAATLADDAAVTPQQAVVLQLIDERPGLIQRDIVDVLQRRAATVSAFLKKLETAGYIVRRVSTDNTRNKQLYLTVSGQRVVAAFERARADVYQQLTVELNTIQQRELLALLTAAQRGLEG
ncbi:MAG: MarR family transcriptional regulator [Levilactobacillus sp.]|jgi:DNA-binding MarR family transcriptional regulator|uniref:MarR family winged helix-turn-helix transcriptional regulator n=1 Tax=Levilactobacillus sp. TaxID=2767919 RepID=UPI00258741D5|nr:MarR family transcriptional regulator [Levilactobacillus sp.]MCI1554340.1 MarR family transcriptional regulator [Levilactobacillus sp.]MCI1599247.1 MarR family transcriptional regulator [Levilactobacillus sp.]MCI1605755.1 MarR family transcriptional regulator [Levilactobacillus sp.]